MLLTGNVIAPCPLLSQHALGFIMIQGIFYARFFPQEGIFFSIGVHA